MSSIHSAAAWQQALDELLSEWRNKELLDFAWSEPPGAQANFNEALTINWAVSKHWLLRTAHNKKHKRYTNDVVAWSAPHTWIMRGHGAQHHFRKIEIYNSSIALTDNSPQERLVYQFPYTPSHECLALLHINQRSRHFDLRFHSLAAQVILQIQELLTQTQKSHHQEPGYQTWLSICDYLQEHFQQEIDRQQVAKLHNIHPNHVSRIFKQYGKRGFSSQLQHIRIQQAAALLRQSNQSLEQIAHACGLHDASYLIRCFKKHMACTPDSYRNNLNK